MQKSGARFGARDTVHFVPHLTFPLLAPQTPRVTQILNDVRIKCRGRLVVSTRRYMWKLDVLQGAALRHTHAGRRQVAGSCHDPRTPCLHLPWSPA